MLTTDYLGVWLYNLFFQECELCFLKTMNSTTFIYFLKTDIFARTRGDLWSLQKCEGDAEYTSEVGRDDRGVPGH